MHRSSDAEIGLSQPGRSYQHHPAGSRDQLPEQIVPRRYCATEPEGQGRNGMAVEAPGILLRLRSTLVRAIGIVVTVGLGMAVRVSVGAAALLFSPSLVGVVA